MHIVYARKPTSDERKKERKKDTLKYYFVRKSFVLVYHHNFLLHVLATCRAHLMRLWRQSNLFLLSLQRFRVYGFWVSSS